ncbi:MAG: HAD family phosphatase [Chlorobiaceae bacterium]|nr:HAD family phosphatase [Chlorobiaceae bacterium]
MIEAVLWDNDGILVDSEALFFDLTRRFFAEAGLVLEEKYWGLEYLGNAKHSYEIALELGLTPELAGPLLDRRNEAFVDRIRKPVTLMPKVRETIEALYGQVRLGIVTGSPRDKLELMHGPEGLLDRFEVIVTDNEVTNPKPHPEPYLKALEMLGIEPGQCLAVEDSRRGLDSAHAAGIACVVVPNALTRVQSFECAYAVEADASGVLKHIHALNSGGRG